MCIDGSLLQNLVFMDIPVVDMSFGISKKKKKVQLFHLYMSLVNCITFSLYHLSSFTDLN